MLNATTELLYKQWEKMFSGFMDYLVRNETFLSSMGKMMEGSSMFKLVVDKSFERALESMRMPTRKDLEETLYAVRKLESAVLDTQEQIETLTDKLDKMAGLLAAQVRIQLEQTSAPAPAPAPVTAPEAVAKTAEAAVAAPKAAAAPKAPAAKKAPAAPKAAAAKKAPAPKSAPKA